MSAPCGCPAVASRVFNVALIGHSPPPAALNRNSAAVTPLLANHMRPANIHAHPPTPTFTLAHVHARTVCAPDCRTACVQCLWCDVCTRCQRSPSAALNRDSAAVTPLVANTCHLPTHACHRAHTHTIRSVCLHCMSTRRWCCVCGVARSVHSLPTLIIRCFETEFGSSNTTARQLHATDPSIHSPTHPPTHPLHNCAHACLFCVCAYPIAEPCVCA
jgi:hypothetical protein